MGARRRANTNHPNVIVDQLFLRTFSKCFLSNNRKYIGAKKGANKTEWPRQLTWRKVRKAIAMKRRTTATAK